MRIKIDLTSQKVEVLGVGVFGGGFGCFYFPFYYFPPHMSAFYNISECMHAGALQASTPQQLSDPHVFTSGGVTYSYLSPWWRVLAIKRLLSLERR